MNEIKFGNKKISNFSEPYFIAEIGANHNGDVNLAKKMIDIAKEKGADCVKFQSWSKNTLFSKIKYAENHFLQNNYKDRKDMTLEESVEKYSLSEKELFEIKKYCDMVEINFASTPFSNREVDFLVDELNVDFIKVASMDVNNIPFLKYIAKKQKPIVLSTGLSKLSEIEQAVEAIYEEGNEQLILLHCVSIYPPKYEEVNLNNIDMLRDIFKIPIGYSDHTIGVGVPIASIAKGACIIEKHFTLDKEMEGWDHKVSADPEELEIIIKEIKRIYKSMGNYNRIVNESEERIREFRRSIVAARDIKEGEIIKFEDLDYKRPAYGLPPSDYKYIVGKKAKRNIKYDEIIKFEDF